MRQFPVTIVCAFVCVALFAIVVNESAMNDVSLGDARWKWNAAVSLIWRAEPELSGMLDLWEGQWWRIPVNAFHHADLMHLSMNMLGLVFLGRVLEPRMGRFWYALFISFGALITILAEVLFENEAVGISGVVFAQLGALIVLRQRDVEVAERIPNIAIGVGISWLILCIPLTISAQMNIANLAHFSGLAYGLAAGYARWPRPVYSTTTRLGFLALHLILLPAVYSAMHPVWIGRYHWYMGIQLRANSGPRISHLRDALERDRGLASVWREIASVQSISGQPLIAWSTMLEGLKHNRSYEEGVLFNRRIWSNLSNADKKKAETALERIFQGETDAWRERLGMNDSVAVIPYPLIFSKRLAADQWMPPEFLPAPDELMRDARRTFPKVDPTSPHSASRETSITL